MSKKNYAVLPGDAGKMELLAQEFKNELVNAQMGCTEVSRGENEIQLKLDFNKFYEGGFHVYKKDSALYYTAFLRENSALFYGIMGIIALVGLIIGLVVGPVGFVTIAGALFWYAIGGSVIYGPYGQDTKLREVKVQHALQTAVSNIRSQRAILDEKPKMGYGQVKAIWDEANRSIQAQPTKVADFFNKMSVAVEQSVRLCYFMVYGRQPESVKAGMASLVEDKVVSERIADCNWVWDIRNDFSHLASANQDDIPRAQRISTRVVEGCLAKIKANLLE